MNTTALYRGKRNYELSNHLGNFNDCWFCEARPYRHESRERSASGVNVVISDKRKSVCDEELGVEYFVAEVLSAVDYYPFHSIIPDRQWYAGNDTSGYRFGGSNGQEKDDEIYGHGNSYSAEYWQYDPRLGRRWNVDPVRHEWESPYATFSTSPVVFLDPKGDEFVNAHEDEKKKAEEGVSRARENRDGLRSKIGDLKKIEDRTKSQSKELRILERQERKADRALIKAENRLTEATAKWEIANSTLEEFKKTNSVLYGQWDRRPEKIVVGGTFTPVRMENSTGQTTGYTDEGTDMNPTKRNTTEVMAVIQLYAPYSTVVSNAQTQSQIERNAANLVHALGHINYYVFGAAEDTESNADAYEKENYWDIKTKNK